MPFGDTLKRSATYRRCRWFVDDTYMNPVMLTQGQHHQGQGQSKNRTIKAYNADITLISVQLSAFIK